MSRRGAADGTEVVLKLGVPNPELTTEIAALRLYDGYGAARLLDADVEAGFLLLERLRPGTPLVEVADDAQATAIAAGVMRKLWRPVPPEHPFPDVRRWRGRSTRCVSATMARPALYRRAWWIRPCGFTMS